MKLKLIYDYLIDFVLPNRCSFCGKFTAWNEPVCQNCKDSIVFADYPIRQDENSVFTLCVSTCEYDGTARNGILNLKYHNGINTAKHLAPYLCELIKAHINISQIDLVTCVPMTRKRRARTGYNHADVVGKLVAELIAKPYDGKLLKRISNAPIQHLLSAEERRKAVKDTYFPAKKKTKLNGKTVLLVDDIITTGSTLSECASVLKSMGADNVYCATLAKTLYNESRKE